MDELIERLRYEAAISDRPGQMDRLNALADEFAAASRAAAREDVWVALVADIRFACGDNGKRSQPELAEYIRGLARDAERYRWLRKGNNDDIAVVRGLGAMDYGMSAVVYTYSEEIDGDDLDAAIDAAKGASHEPRV